MYKKICKNILIGLNKFNFTLYLFKITFDIGWYWGENFRLFHCNFFEINTDCNMIVVLDLYFLKFVIELLIDI